MTSPYNTMTPCGWGNPIFTCDISTLNPAVTGVAKIAATEILNARTGYQFGPCQMTIRPCRKDCYDMDVWPYGSTGLYWQWGMWPRPFWYNGVWYNLTCGQCTTGCSCSVISEALLPAPVNQIVQVKVDGAVLPTSAYRLDDYRKLVRLGGMWPICNDLSKADTEVGTWSVTLTIGMDVPQLGLIALGELTEQISRLLCADEACVLPKPTQQIIRQGVTMNFLDPTEIFANGQIGLYLTDMFISAMNPNHLQSRSGVYSPDSEWYRITS